MYLCMPGILRPKRVQVVASRVLYSDSFAALNPEPKKNSGCSSRVLYSDVRL